MMALGNVKVQPPIAFRYLNGIYIGRVMKAGQRRLVGSRAVDEILLIQPAQRPTEIHRQRHPGNAQGMARAVGSAPINLAGDETRREMGFRGWLFFVHRLKVVSCRGSAKGAGGILLSPQQRASILP